MKPESVVLVTTAPTLPYFAIKFSEIRDLEYIDETLCKFHYSDLKLKIIILFFILLQRLDEYVMNYFLTSDYNIPNRFIEKFNRLTALSIENGVSLFYWDSVDFLIRTRLGEKGRNTFRAFSLTQFQIFVFIYLVCMALTVLVFFIEIIFYYVKFHVTRFI